MAVSTSGRFAVLTNFPSEPKDGDENVDDGGALGKKAGVDAPPLVSRGTLVRGFVEGSANAGEYAKDVVERGNEFDGFNLLVWDGFGPIMCVQCMAVTACCTLLPPERAPCSMRAVRVQVHLSCIPSPLFRCLQ